LKAKHAKAQEELKKLQNAEKNVQKQREAAMKDMEKQVKDSQKVVTKLRSELSQLKHSRDLIAGELENAKKDVKLGAEQLIAAEKTVARLAAEVDQLGNKVSLCLPCCVYIVLLLDLN
jgi:hypothetical protein